MERWSRSVALGPVMSNVGADPVSVRCDSGSIGTLVPVCCRSCAVLNARSVKIAGAIQNGIFIFARLTFVISCLPPSSYSTQRASNLTGGIH